MRLRVFSKQKSQHLVRLFAGLNGYSCCGRINFIRRVLLRSWTNLTGGALIHSGLDFEVNSSNMAACLPVPLQ
jgi:hypothetical protein